MQDRIIIKINLTNPSEYSKIEIFGNGSTYLLTYSLHGAGYYLKS
jgi:hypothetical protein